MNAVLHLNSKDNVVTCLRPLHQGETITLDTVSLTTTMDIPAFHKIALTDIPAGSLCYKYGEVIGEATQAIAAGDHVHVHNLASTRGRGDKENSPRSAQ